jgi:hypothetical protein
MLWALATSKLVRSLPTLVITRSSKIRVPAIIRDKVDFSRVPRLDPKDITERTHRGSGWNAAGLACPFLKYCLFFSVSKKRPIYTINDFLLQYMKWQ